MAYYRIYVLDVSDNIVCGTAGEYSSDAAALEAARARLQPGQEAEVSTEIGSILHVRHDDGTGAPGD